MGLLIVGERLNLSKNWVNLCSHQRTGLQIAVCSSAWMTGDACNFA